MRAEVLAAELGKARRAHERRLDKWAADGEREDEPKESIEAEAGAQLEARFAVDLHTVRDIAQSWAEAHRKK